MKKEYDILLSQSDIENITSFLEQHDFEEKEHDIFYHKYHFQNQDYQDKMTGLSFNIHLTYETVQSRLVMEAKVEDEKVIPFSVRPYIKLLFKTCYSIVNAQDKRDKDWKKYHRKMDKFKSVGGSVKKVLEILDAISDVI